MSTLVLVYLLAGFLIIGGSIPGLFTTPIPKGVWVQFLFGVILLILFLTLGGRFI